MTLAIIDGKIFNVNIAASDSKKLKMINITIVAPENYVHHQAFSELADLLKFSIIDSGHQCIISFNKINSNGTNIILGAHLLSTSLIPKIPKNTIILNTEQIYIDDTKWNETVYRFVKEFPAIDYSERNILKFNQLGYLHVNLLKIGYQKELRRIQKSKIQDVDVLFYGSINDRRRRILNELALRGLKVKHLFGVYGEERDQWISRSKVVLNLHLYQSKIFEIVRVFYLMTNSAAVVTEVDPDTQIDSIYKDGLCTAPYSEIVDKCIELVQSNSLRHQLENSAFETISKYPQIHFTKQALKI